MRRARATEQDFHPQQERSSGRGTVEKHDRDYLQEAKLERAEEKARRETTLKKLQATMAPKAPTAEEAAMVEEQLAHVYANEFVVPTDNMLAKHVASYSNSQEDARYTFNSYMHNFLTLNRDLRTDANGITTLLDNVPSVFALPEAGTECYYSFTVNFDLNAKGTVKVLLKSEDRVRVYISDTVKKP